MLMEHQWISAITKFVVISVFGLLLHLRPNYIHRGSNDIHTDGPRARG